MPYNPQRESDCDFIGFSRFLVFILFFMIIFHIPILKKSCPRFGVEVTVIRYVGLITLLFALPVLAQPPDTLWSQSYGNGTAETVLTVRPVADGGFILCGNTDEGSGYMASWIMRTDSDGNELWHTLDGGDLSNASGHIEPTLDGGFIHGGSTWSYSGNLSWDGSLSKLDADGTPEWQRAIGSPSYDDYISSVCVVPTGGYAATGIWQGEPFLWRVGGQGGTQWLRTHPNNNNNSFNYVDSQGDGFVIAAEWGDRFAVMRTDNIGNLEWQYATDHTGRAECVRSHEGDTFACGYRILPGGWARSWYVTRVDALGNLVWERSLDSATSESAEELWIAADNTLIVSGWGQSPDLTINRWLFKYDLDGNLLWDYTLPGGQANTVAQAVDGGYVFSGTHGQTFLSSTDFRLFKTEPEVSVELIPHWTTIPPEGQNMSFAGQITNILALQTDFDLWADVLMPNGDTTLILEMPLTLTPGQTITRNAVDFFVPGAAPGGIYTYTLHIGNQITGQNMGVGSFDFFKAGGGNEGVDYGDLHANWTHRLSNGMELRTR
jgi:hypothetical protein